MIDLQTLDAFADGALPPEEAARVVLYLADHPEEARYVDALMEVNSLLAAAYADPLHEPVPEQIRAVLYPGTVPLRRRAAPRPGHALAALAATLLFGLALGAGLQALRGPQGFDRLGAEVVRLLETGPSGTTATLAAGGDILLIATFADAEGRPCREYEILRPEPEAARTQAIACRSNGGTWKTEAHVESGGMVVDAAPGEDRFKPADGAPAAALDPALDRLGAGLALSPAEEQVWIARGWAP